MSKNNGHTGYSGVDEDLPLVEQALAGDKRAFETLVRRHERSVYDTTLSVTKNQQDAEEAMQDAFMKAYRYLPTFRREARFATWLTRIALNEALQKIRHRAGGQWLMTRT